LSWLDWLTWSAAGGCADTGVPYLLRSNWLVVVTACVAPAVVGAADPATVVSVAPAGTCRVTVLAIRTARPSASIQTSTGTSVSFDVA